MCCSKQNYRAIKFQGAFQLSPKDFCSGFEKENANVQQLGGVGGDFCFPQQKLQNIYLYPSCQTSKWPVPIHTGGYLWGDLLLKAPRKAHFKGYYPHPDSPLVYRALYSTPCRAIMYLVIYIFVHSKIMPTSCSSSQQANSSLLINKSTSFKGFFQI